jgi:hypothetical protein
MFSNSIEILCKKEKTMSTAFNRNIFMLKVVIGLYNCMFNHYRCHHQYHCAEHESRHS